MGGTNPVDSISFTPPACPSDTTGRIRQDGDSVVFTPRPRGTRNDGTRVQVSGTPKASKSDDEIQLKVGNTVIARLYASHGFFSEDAHFKIPGGGDWKLDEAEYWGFSPDHLNGCHFDCSNGRITTDDAVGELVNQINGAKRKVITDNNGTMRVEVTPGNEDYIPIEQWALLQYNGAD